MFTASVAGIVVSYSLLKEDVLSSANTLFNFFPSQFGVTPAQTYEGAIRLGIFLSLLQIVTLSIALSKEFLAGWRVVAGFLFAFSFPFDSWTDIVFRSGYLTGDFWVATVTTFSFYTVGSELLQSMSWLVAVATWRGAISDYLWISARFKAGIKSIGKERSNFDRAATNQENKALENSQSANPPTKQNIPTQIPRASVAQNANRPQRQASQSKEAAKAQAEKLIDEALFAAGENTITAAECNRKLDKAAEILRNAGYTSEAVQTIELKFTNDEMQSLSATQQQPPEPDYFPIPSSGELKRSNGRSYDA